MHGRVAALTLAVTLSSIGTPIAASASGVADPVARVHASDDDQLTARRLTVQGRPLAQILSGTFETRGRVSHTQPRARGSLIRGGLEVSASLAQATASSRPQYRLPQRSNRTRNIWLGVAIGAGAGALTGWAIGTRPCGNEGGADPNCIGPYVGIFGLIGAGVGAALGSSF